MMVFRAILLLAAVAATPAWATPEDDFAACLIGQAAVIMHNQTGKKDPMAAQEKAGDICQMPADIDGDELDGIGDFVNAAITSIADGVYRK